MATKVTQEMIEQMNEAYVDLKTYAAVGRKFGVTGTTVKRYIIPNYIKKADIIVNKLSAEKINSINDFICSKELLLLNTALQLTDTEKIEMTEFWKELAL